jgi:hypothetical protein
MIDFAVLNEYGTTNERLREVLAAEPMDERRKAALASKLSPSDFDAKLQAIDKDVGNRKRFEDQLKDILQEQIVWGLRNHHRYSAVDLSWDSSPINKRVLPLMLYAQGRIDTTAAEKSLRALPDGATYLKKNEAGQTVVDLPKFTEVNVNLCRSVLTRRVAAQAVKYDKLWPFFKYEPRSQTQVGKLRADLVGQRMDIMADQYGYRRQMTQAIRKMLLYAECVVFPRASWERDVQIETDPTIAPEFTQGTNKLPKRTRVVREGLSWVSPHPSRLIFDNKYPLASLNTDTGCEYVGFWDVARWGDIHNNPVYFNRKSVQFSADTASWFTNYANYFAQYYDKVTPPQLPSDTQPGLNDRVNNVGVYTGSMESHSVFFTHLWKKIIPQEWGVGRYPHPVWVHLKVAGNGTVVYADICPSSPCAVFSYNTNDDRLANISMMEELMPYQDQITNLFSQFLAIAKADLFSVAVLNTDIFPDTDEGRKVRDEFRRCMTGQNFYEQTQILEVGFEKLKQLGIDPTKVFTVVRSHPNTALSSVLEAITSTINMAERNQVMSQHEQGQVAPHEISATESNQLAGSTETIYSFISTAIDEGRAAMKRICYESLMSRGSDDVVLTAASRYPDSVIQEAGFQVVDTDNDEPLGYFTIMGAKQGLRHDFIFTSRDGGDRVSNQQGATALIQMFQSIGSLDQNVQHSIFDAMGKQKVFEIMNSVFRMADAGVDLKLEVRPGESDSLMIENDQQVMGIIQQLGQAVKQNTQDLAQLKQAAGMPSAPPPQGGPPMMPPGGMPPMPPSR